MELIIYISPNQAEFICYQLLLVYFNEQTRGFTTKLSFYLDKMPELLETPQLTLLLEIVSCLESNNYTKYFQLIRNPKKTDYLLSTLLTYHQFIWRIRLDAIKIHRQAFRSSFSYFTSESTPPDLSTYVQGFDQFYELGLDSGKFIRLSDLKVKLGFVDMDKAASFARLCYGKNERDQRLIQIDGELWFDCNVPDKNFEMLGQKMVSLPSEKFRVLNNRKVRGWVEGDEEDPRKFEVEVKRFVRRSQLIKREDRCSLGFDEGNRAWVEGIHENMRKMRGVELGGSGGGEDGGLQVVMEQEETTVEVETEVETEEEFTVVEEISGRMVTDSEVSSVVDEESMEDSSVEYERSMEDGSMDEENLNTHEVSEGLATSQPIESLSLTEIPRERLKNRETIELWCRRMGFFLNRGNLTLKKDFLQKWNKLHLETAAHEEQILSQFYHKKIARVKANTYSKLLTFARTHHANFQAAFLRAKHLSQKPHQFTTLPPCLAPLYHSLNLGLQTCPDKAQSLLNQHHSESLPYLLGSLLSTSIIISENFKELTLPKFINLTFFVIKGSIQWYELFGLVNQFLALRPEDYGKLEFGGIVGNTVYINFDRRDCSAEEDASRVREIRVNAEIVVIDDVCDINLLIEKALSSAFNFFVGAAEEYRYLEQVR